jgi:DNA polymerase I-like protein with 3'-5' exonuclease and polymerase domains
MRCKQSYVDTFFGTYKGILPYFKEEYDKLTRLEISERVLKNPVTGRIRRFPRSKSDKLMREMKATLLQQVESHMLKVSLMRISNKIKRKGLDASMVACIHDSLWMEATEALVRFTSVPAQAYSMLRELLGSARPLSRSGKNGGICE